MHLVTQQSILSDCDISIRSSSSVLLDVEESNDEYDSRCSSPDIVKDSSVSKKYPNEPWKFLQAVLILFFGIFVSCLSLAAVHDRQPLSPPLPDVVFRYISQVDYGLELSEYLILVVTYCTFAAVLFHQHRWIILRRIFIMTGLLYIGRAITMFVTALPQANLKYPCSAKANETDMATVLYRAFYVFSGLGMAINGKLIYCGDFIYSGHTCSLIMCCLVFAEYTPQSIMFFRICKRILYAVSAAAITLVSVSRTHYTVDIIIAYVATTVLFRIYHSVALQENSKNPSTPNYLSDFWFFSLISHFERNVPPGRLPMNYGVKLQKTSIYLYIRKAKSFAQNMFYRLWENKSGTSAEQPFLSKESFVV